MLRVAVDAGHFSSHPGACAHGVREVDINKRVIEYLKTELAYQGISSVECVGTSSSVKESAKQKAAAANKANADIYVSVHCNSYILASAHGCETYHYPSSSKGKILAGYIRDQVVNEFGLRDRGVKSAKFIVLQKTSMAAALLEWAFLSNPQERALMVDPNNQKRCAKAISYAVLRYFGKAPQTSDSTTTIADLQAKVDQLQDKINRAKAILN